MVNKTIDTDAGKGRTLLTVQTSGTDLRFSDSLMRIRTERKERWYVC